MAATRRTRTKTVASTNHADGGNPEASAPPASSLPAVIPDPLTAATTLFQSLALSPSSDLPDYTPSPFDKCAWALARQGKSPEEISALLGCELLQAQQGVIRLNTWMASVSDELRNARANEQVIKALDGAGQVFLEAQRADRMIVPPVLDPDSKLVIQDPVFIPDHDTRLAATRALGEFADKFTPKRGASINIGNTQNNNYAGEGGTSFEARVRAIRERRGMRNDDVGAGRGAGDEEEIEDSEDIEDAEIVGDDDNDSGDDAVVSRAEYMDGDDGTVRNVPGPVKGDVEVSEEYTDEESGR